MHLFLTSSLYLAVHQFLHFLCVHFQLATKDPSTRKLFLERPAARRAAGRQRGHSLQCDAVKGVKHQTQIASQPATYPHAPLCSQNIFSMNPLEKWLHLTWSLTQAIQAKETPGQFWHPTPNEPEGFARTRVRPEPIIAPSRSPPHLRLQTRGIRQVSASGKFMQFFSCLVK